MDLVEQGPSEAKSVSGTFTATGHSAAFVPDAGRSFNISLWGAFSATIQLERSFDGTTWLPLTAAGIQLCIWTGPASEGWEEDRTSTQYRLNIPTTYTSGTVNYLINQ